MKEASLPAEQRLWQLMTAYWLSQAIYVAARLGVADLLAGGPKTGAELATQTETRPDNLRRLLRYLASAGIFAQTADQRFGLAPLGECLRADAPNSMRAAILMYGEEAYRAWGNLLHSVQTGEPAFDHTFGSPYFQYLDDHPQSRQVFNDAMTAVRWRGAALATSYDFSGVSTVIDVGGGQGALIASILAAHPHVRGTLFDLPEVVRTARAGLEARGLASRCELVGGSFFESVPAGGDVYVLSHIVHDWDDEHSVDILRCCRKAMGGGSRLLLIERVVPDDDRPSAAKAMDLHMMVLFASKERTADEYRALLASSGLRLQSISEMPSAVSIIEAVPA